MKIKVFIVTWQDENALNKNLESLFSAFSYLPPDVDIHVNIINNHTNFKIDPRFEPHVNVIHNRGTPDFATAMLARMWNMALIHGFKDLKNPDADIVVTAQDDTIWNTDWVHQLLDVHQQFDFYAGDAGDMVCSYTPEAVRKIGLWDERFHYGFGEADYFLRAIRWLPESSSINDYAHARLWNESVVFAQRPTPDDNRYIEQGRSHKFRGLSWAVFLHKWKRMEMEAKWPPNIREMILNTPMVDHFVMYPYFEKDVEDIAFKGYVV